MKSVGPPSLVKGKAEIESKTHITELTLLQNLVLFLYAAKYGQQKLDGEVAPSGLLGTEELVEELSCEHQGGQQELQLSFKAKGGIP